LDLVGKEIFSIEKDFMEEKSLNLKIYAYISDGYFIDIGIPEDYFKAQKDFEEGNISR
jgi:D-glycero-alpha-D-manno-heptose 1-phosphate guanylyltransferase